MRPRFYAGIDGNGEGNGDRPSSPSFNEAPLLRGDRPLTRAGLSTCRSGFNEAPLLRGDRPPACSTIRRLLRDASMRPRFYAGIDMSTANQSIDAIDASMRPRFYAGIDRGQVSENSTKPPSFNEAPLLRGDRRRTSLANPPQPIVCFNEAPLLRGDRPGRGGISGTAHITSFNEAPLLRGDRQQPPS